MTLLKSVRPEFVTKLFQLCQEENKEVEAISIAASLLQAGYGILRSDNTHEKVKSFLDIFFDKVRDDAESLIKAQ